MAKVPVYGPRKATLDPIQRQFFQANTSPAAHGAGIGRALQHVASGLDSFANGIAAQEALDDQAVVNDAMNQYRSYVRERSYNPDTGFFMQNGENAVRGRVDFEEDLETKRLEIGKNLNAKQKRIYDRNSTERKQRAFDSGIKHSASQRKAWFIENSKATLESLADDALAFSVEPDKFEGVIIEGERHLDEQGQLHAWSDTQLKLEKERWRSTIHSNMIKQLASQDPELAQQWLDNNQDKMSEKDRVNMENLLDDPVREQRADREADRILRGEETDEPDTIDHQGHKIEVIKPKYGEADELSKPAEDRVKIDPKGPKVDSSINKKKAPIKWDGRDLKTGIVTAAKELGIDPYVLATVISYETAGTFDATIKGPTTQWGQHRGFIQFGQPQAKQFGVDWKNPVGSQLGPQGAVVKYLKKAGVKPGMDLLHVYAAINAGDPYKFGASDANNGGAPGTVRDKVLYQMADHKAKARRLLGGDFVGPQYVQAQLDKISDPKLRAATERRISAKLTMGAKIDRARQRRAKIAAEKMIIAHPNMKPSQLPLDIQQEIGIEGMTALKNYHDKQGLVDTDEETYLGLLKRQAEDPSSFANDVDLLDYIDKLSKQDLREFAKMQAKTLKDEREGANKALTESRSLSTAMSIAKLRLEETGVIKKTSKRKNEDIKREAQFQKMLAERMREFQKTEKRLPSDLEISDMVDQLLTPIILRTPGNVRGAPSGFNLLFNMFDGSTEEGLLFEAPYRKDGATVELNVPYENIPVDVRNAIRAELTKELKREPTQDEIIKDYVDFVLTGK